MPDSIRGFKVTDIVDRLTLDILRLLEDILTANRFEQDRLYLGLLLTLSRKTYVNKLLFRDFSASGESQWYSLPMPDGGDARVHEQSVTYLQQVLARRPKLARRLQHEPGNMHLLLGALCRFGPEDQDWRTAEVKRDQTQEKADDRDDFRIPLGRALAALCKSQGTNYSAESTRRREQYGPLWLIREPYAAEVPEEISFFEVAEALPVPLAPSFVSDTELQRLLARVMDALNERYMLLRGCGLNPTYWHDRDDPSISRLRELKRLRQEADELLRLGIESSNVDAYQRVFNSVEGRGQKFRRLCQLRRFCRRRGRHADGCAHTALSIDEALGDDGDGESWLRHEAIADPDAIDIEEDLSMRDAGSQWVTDLIEARPKMFDPVMRYFFEQVPRAKAGPCMPVAATPAFSTIPSFALCSTRIPTLPMSTRTTSPIISPNVLKP